MRQWLCCALLGFLLLRGGILVASRGSSIALIRSGIQLHTVSDAPNAKFKVMNWPVERRSVRYGSV